MARARDHRQAVHLRGRGRLERVPPHPLAWGGTQLTPRLVGAETAVKFIVQNPMRQNKMLTAAEAVELGLSDRLLEPVEFLDRSIDFAMELVEGKQAQNRDADLS